MEEPRSKQGKSASAPGLPSNEQPPDHVEAAPPLANQEDAGSSQGPGEPPTRHPFWHWLLPWKRPSKEKRRSNEFWLAAIGLIATAVSGTLGAAITWFSAAEHDKATFEQEEKRAQDTFTQSQRKDAYAAFDIGIDHFRETLWAEMRLALPDAHNPLFPPLQESVGESVNNLVFAESKITFYGSEEAHKKASEVVRQVWIIRAPLLAFLAEHSNYPNLSQPESEEFRTKVIPQVANSIYWNLRVAQRDFRDAARRDLHLPILPPDSIDPLYIPALPSGPAAAAVPATPAIVGPPGH